MFGSVYMSMPLSHFVTAYPSLEIEIYRGQLICPTLKSVKEEGLPFSSAVREGGGGSICQGGRGIVSLTLFGIVRLTFIRFKYCF